jgi:hypothetical protein
MAHILCKKFFHVCPQDSSTTRPIGLKNGTTPWITTSSWWQVGFQQFTLGQFRRMQLRQLTTWKGCNSKESQLRGLCRNGTRKFDPKEIQLRLEGPQLASPLVAGSDLAFQSFKIGWMSGLLHNRAQSYHHCRWIS